MDFSKINWKAVIPSGLIIWFLALVINLVIGYGYSFYVGFQTRGDMEAVQEASLAFTTSILFKIIIWLILGLLTFWRGRKVAQKATDAPLINALAVGVVAMLVNTLVTLIMPGFDVLLWGGSWLVVLIAAYFSGTTGTKQEATA